MDKIQIPYKVMMERMIKFSRGDTVNINVARRVFTYYYRMPRQLINSMFRELKTCGAIVPLDKQTIRVLWTPKDESNGIW